MERKPQLEDFIQVSLNATEYPHEFWRCWRLDNCGACVQGDTNGCAWCPYVRLQSLVLANSSYDIPNSHLLSIPHQSHTNRASKPTNSLIETYSLHFLPYQHPSLTTSQQSQTCVPLPTTSTNPFSKTILAPMSYPSICPFPWQERWELRTKPFGCNCSTTTFIAALITCVSTLVSLLILISLLRCLRWSFRACRGLRGGWEVKIVDEPDGERRIGRIWIRRRSWREWWRRLRRNEDEVITERTRLLG